MTCRHCGHDEDDHGPEGCPCGCEGFERPERLTRNEQLQELADSGCDTWEEYRGER